MWFAERLQKLHNIFFSELILFIKSVILLAEIRLGLSLFGLCRVQVALRYFAKLSKKPTIAHQDSSIWIIKARETVRNASSNRFFYSSCLVQALFFWFLLKQRDLPGALCIGVNQEQGRYNAHAWIEDSGVVLYDAQEMRDQFIKFDTVIDYSSIG